MTSFTTEAREPGRPSLRTTVTLAVNPALYDAVVATVTRVPLLHLRAPPRSSVQGSCLLHPDL